MFIEFPKAKSIFLRPQLVLPLQLNNSSPTILRKSDLEMKRLNLIILSLLTPRQWEFGSKRILLDLRPQTSLFILEYKNCTRKINNQTTTRTQNSQFLHLAPMKKKITKYSYWKKNMNKNSAFFKICCGDLSIFINIEWLIGFIHPVEQHNSFFLSKLTRVLK